MALFVRLSAAVVVGGVVFGAAVGVGVAQVARLGAMGDSLTDEYAEQSYSYARNWTMLLVQQRGGVGGFDMGPTAVAAGQAGGTWGEPRRTGYASNWARYGADSATALTQGQHVGLASQVGGGGSGGGMGVSHVVVAIGANDFSPSTDAFFNIYFGLWSSSQITSYVNGRIANIRTAVQTLSGAGAQVVLCNVVDFGVAPVSRQLYTNATLRSRVSAAVARVNTGVEAIAQQNGAVLVDLNAMSTAILGTNSALKQFLRIGNVDIQLFNRDTASHTNPLAGFVDDGAHPHTAVQGVFANLMMTSLNVGWGTSYAMFTDREILENAGIAYGGADTLAGQIGPYTQFVRSYACPSPFITSQPVAASSGGVGGATFAVGVANGANGGPLAYQWQWRMAGSTSWTAVVNGANPAPAGFVAQNAQTAAITVSQPAGNAQPPAPGRIEFRVLVGNACDPAGVASAAALWTVCPADVNNDGFLDGFDYDDFVAAFEAGGEGADFNRDGFVDGFDYDDFVAAFEQGC